MEIKAMVNEQGVVELEVLGIPYGDAYNKDKTGEYFSKRTDLMIVDKGKAEFPVLWHHGMGDNLPQVIGRAKYLREDEKGHWFRVVVSAARNVADDLLSKAKQGLLKVSSGAVGHLVRKARDGELLSWCLGELSLTLTPANPAAVALPIMKAHYKAADMQTPTEWEKQQEKNKERLQKIERSDEHGVLKQLHKISTEDPDIHWKNDPWRGR